MDRRTLSALLCEVKEWLKTQPHLPKCASEEDEITEALILRNGPFLSLVKLKLDAYYSLRAQFSEPFFCNRDPKTIRWHSVMKYMMLEDGVMLAVPPLSERGKYYSAEESGKLLLMLLDSYSRQHGGKMFTLTLMFDATHITQEIVDKHNRQYSNVFSLILETYPVKVKQVIFFNVNPQRVLLCNELTKDLGSNGSLLLTSQIVVDHKSLAKFLSLEILPSDYEQGRNLSIKALWEKVQQRLMRERVWFMSAGSQTTDESYRP